MPAATTTKDSGQQRFGGLKLRAKKRLLPPTERRILLVGIAALLLLLTAAIAYVADWGTSVVVRDPDGRVFARSSLSGSGDFRIEYVHSYYEAPAAEHFVAERNGDFELVEISSPSEAVLDYYELEGRKSADGKWMSLTPDEPRRFDTLPLIGTEKGRRTLVTPEGRLPLYAEDGPRHLTIRVEEDTAFTELRGVLARATAGGEPNPQG